jgi:hypothetical protein
MVQYPMIQPPMPSTTGLSGATARPDAGWYQRHMDTHDRVIQCTPPGDRRFLQAVTHAYDQASRDLSAEIPLLVWTLVLIRRRYPVAVITLLARGGSEDPGSSVWLVARDGWGAARPSSQRRTSWLSRPT